MRFMLIIRTVPKFEDAANDDVDRKHAPIPFPSAPRPKANRQSNHERTSCSPIPCAMCVCVMRLPLSSNKHSLYFNYILPLTRLECVFCCSSSVLSKHILRHIPFELYPLFICSFSLRTIFRCEPIKRRTQQQKKKGGAIHVLFHFPFHRAFAGGSTAVGSKIDICVCDACGPSARQTRTHGTSQTACIRCEPSIYNQQRIRMHCTHERLGHERTTADLRRSRSHVCIV